jgi:RHS repeat-associated protein
MTYTYNAFGTPIETGTVANPFTFTGQPSDSNAGLVQFPLRTYDPSLGRFLSLNPPRNLARTRRAYTKSAP